MSAYIIVPTEVGNVVIGVAQIATITVGGRRGEHANINLGNRQQVTALLSVQGVLDLIDEANKKPTARKAK